MEKQEDQDKVKKLEEYKQEKPIQLSLFEFLLPQERKYSNSIELYDFIPKYVWGKVERENGKYLQPLTRHFVHKEENYKVTIKPASVKGKDGVYRHCFPSKREELVEDALRKLACEGGGIFLDDHAGVTFTFYRLRHELEKRGHGYKLAEIREALYILSETHLELITTDGQTVMKANMFQTLGLQTQEDWEGTGQKTRAFARFNPLVTDGIKNKTFRQLNYEKSMSFRSTIARQFYKRLSHHYTYASLTKSYHILLSTIIRDFGLTTYAELRNNLRDVCKALEELKEKEVVLTYEIERTLDVKQRHRLIEAKITLWPHTNFSSDVIKANQRKTKTLSFSSAKI